MWNRRKCLGIEKDRVLLGDDSGWRRLHESFGTFRGGFERCVQEEHEVDIEGFVAMVFEFDGKVFDGALGVN